MCGCEDDDVTSELVALTPKEFATLRRLEREMPGARVQDKCWAVFIGQSAGSLSYVDFSRLYVCKVKLLSGIRARDHMRPLAQRRLVGRARLACG